MNFALSINENFFELEKALLKRIADLRQKIAQKQQSIESRVNDLHRISSEDQLEIAARTSELKERISRFSAAVIDSQSNPRFDKQTRRYLHEFLSTLRYELSGQLGEMGGIFGADEPIGDEHTDGQSAQHSKSSAAQDSTDEQAHSRGASHGFPFEDFAATSEEYEREMREFRRKQRLKDPFSPESLAALRQSPEDPVVRKLYIQLSKQIHPDLAKSPQQAAERTEFMQRLAGAYAARDYAQLLAIQERITDGGFSANTSGTEEVTEGRIATLRSSMEQLEAQLKTLTKHSNRMSRSSTGRLLKERRSNKGIVQDPFLVGLLRVQEMVEAVTNLIAEAASGRMKMSTLRKRCDTLLQEDPQDGMDEGDFETFLNMMIRQFEPQPPRHRKRGKKL